MSFSKSLVSISDAAKMVDVTRSTLYTHIEEKGITVIDKNTKRPKIDVSELVRVYGDKVRPLEEIAKGKKSKEIESDPDLIGEISALREKVKSLEMERSRERDQLSERIENLQESLKKEQEVVGRVTALLTDQRKEADKGSEESRRLEAIEVSMKALLAHQEKETVKQSWWPFGRKKA